MTDPSPATRRHSTPPFTPSATQHPLAAAATVAFVVLVAGCLTWSFLSMRAVMQVGGTCASGGPYVTAQQCPAGGELIAFAVPVLVIASLAGSATAAFVNAPNLLLPMWAFLFGALGFNFLDAAFSGGVEITSLLCGVMFELMALPAFIFIWAGIRDSVSPRTGAAPHVATRWWFAAYVVLGWAGIAFGWWSFAALT